MVAGQEPPGVLLKELEAARAARDKQGIKRSLHALCLASGPGLAAALDAAQPPGSLAEELLSTLQPHLVVPHPLSITATGSAYTLLEQLLHYLAARQPLWQKQQQLQQRAASAEPHDSKQGRDTGSAARSPKQQQQEDQQQQQAGAPSLACQQRLLCQLHATAALAWQAVASKPQGDLSLSQYVLAYQASARRTLVLLQRYGHVAGLTDALRQQLLGLLQHATVQHLQPRGAHDAPVKADAAAAAAAAAAAPGLAPAAGLVLVKQEPHSQDDAASSSQQLSAPLIHSLAQLMACAKANRRQAAGAGSGNSPTAAPAAAAAQARADELSVSGVQTWGLMAACLGPLMLDKAVGQPLLNLLQGTFTDPDVSLRLASFQAWHAFIDCCWAAGVLVRKRVVLLSPITHALQTSSTPALRLAAVGAWARLALRLLPAAPARTLLWVVDGGAGAAADGPCLEPPQSCEGLTASAVDLLIKPVVDLVMGYPPLVVAATGSADEAAGSIPPSSSSAGKGGGGNKAAAKKEKSCLAAAPVLQCVLEQALLLHDAAAASATSDAGNANTNSSGSNGQQQQLAAGELGTRLLQLITSAVCGNTAAVALLRGAPGATPDNPPAAPGGGCLSPAPAAADATPAATRHASRGSSAPAAAAGSAQRGGGAFGLLGLTDTPPPNTPLFAAGGGGAAAAGGLTPAGHALLQLRTPAVTPPRQDAQGQQQGTPPQGATRPPAHAHLLLEHLPGWLQLAMGALQLLAPPAGSLRESQQPDTLLQVRQAWLPAWQGLMQLLGATQAGGANDGEHHQAGRLAAATAAAVQCLCAFQHVLQPWLSARSMPAARLLHNAAAALLAHVPQQMLAQQLPAGALPVDLAGAAANVLAPTYPQQPADCTTGSGGAADLLLQHAGSAAAGRPLWALVSEVLVAALGATTTPPPAAAGGAAADGGQAADGAAAAGEQEQYEASLLRCLAWCCAAASPSEAPGAVHHLLKLAAGWGAPAASLRLWCIVTDSLLLQPLAGGEEAAGTASSGPQAASTPQKSPARTPSKAPASALQCGDGSGVSGATGLHAAIAAAAGDTAGGGLKALRHVCCWPLRAMRLCCREGAVGPAAARQQRTDQLLHGVAAVWLQLLLRTLPPRQAPAMQQQQQQASAAAALAALDAAEPSIVQADAAAGSSSTAWQGVAPKLALPLLLSLHALPASMLSAWSADDGAGGSEHGCSFAWLLPPQDPDSSSCHAASGAAAATASILWGAARLATSLQELVEVQAAAAGLSTNRAALQGAAAAPTQASPTNTAALASRPTAAMLTGGGSIAATARTNPNARAQVARLVQQQQQVQQMLPALLQLSCSMLGWVGQHQAGGRPESTLPEETQQQQAALQLAAAAVACVCCMPDAHAAAQVLAEQLMPPLQQLAGSGVALQLLTVAVPPLLQQLLVWQGQAQQQPCGGSAGGGATADATTTAAAALEQQHRHLQRCFDALTPLLLQLYAPGHAAAGQQLRLACYQQLNTLVERSCLQDGARQTLVLPLALTELLEDAVAAKAGLITGSMCPEEAACVAPRLLAAAARSPAAAAAGRSPCKQQAGALASPVGPPAAPGARTPSKLPGATVDAPPQSRLSPLQPRGPSFIRPAASPGGGGGGGTTPKGIGAAAATAAGAGGAAQQQPASTPPPAAVAGSSGSKRRRLPAGAFLHESQTEYVRVPTRITPPGAAAAGAGAAGAGPAGGQHVREIIGRRRRAALNTYTTLDTSQPAFDVDSSMGVESEEPEAPAASLQHTAPAAAAPAAAAAAAEQPAAAAPADSATAAATAAAAVADGAAAPLAGSAAVAPQAGAAAGGSPGGLAEPDGQTAAAAAGLGGRQHGAAGAAGPSSPVDHVSQSQEPAGQGEASAQVAAPATAAMPPPPPAAAAAAAAAAQPAAADQQQQAGVIADSQPADHLPDRRPLEQQQQQQQAAGDQAAVPGSSGMMAPPAAVIGRPTPGATAAAAPPAVTAPKEAQGGEGAAAAAAAPLAPPHLAGSLADGLHELEIDPSQQWLVQDKGPATSGQQLARLAAQQQQQQQRKRGLASDSSAGSGSSHAAAAAGGDKRQRLSVPTTAATSGSEAPAAAVAAAAVSGVQRLAEAAQRQPHDTAMTWLEGLTQPELVALQAALANESLRRHLAGPDEGGGMEQ